MVREDLVVGGENGAKWEIVDVGRLLGGCDDLMENCDILGLVSRANDSLVFSYMPASVRGDSSSRAACSSRGGDDGRIDFAYCIFSKA